MKKVIITGASMGIGKGIATCLGRREMILGLVSRSTDRLEELCSRITRDGSTCHYEGCDLRDYETVEAAMSRLVEAMGGVDALINNAGLVIRKDVMEISLEEWHAMIDTNINGLFYATRAVLPHLIRQKSGHIINISSISGRVPLPGGSGYAATKYAVTGFSESMFQEVRRHGVKVSVIFPGSVESESHRHDSESDTSWKIQPEEVGQVCHDLLQTSDTNCISQVEIRPLNKP
jgi:3-oxoacyl-[acyl-carrier protein] reductase